MQDFGSEMYENKSAGCNFCSSAVVDFVSQGGCHNTRFFKEVAFTEVHLTTAYSILRNEMKRNETKRNETKRNETKRNEMKRNKTKYIGEGEKMLINLNTA